MEQATIETTTEEASVKAQIDLIQEWISEDFIDAVIQQARAKSVERRLQEKKQELQSKINEAQVAGDLDAMIQLTAALQALQNLRPDPVPNIPWNAIESAIQKARGKVLSVLSLLDNQMPPKLDNVLLMSPHSPMHSFAFQKATDEEKIALQAWYNFQPLITRYRERVNNWLYLEGIADVLTYLLEGKNLITSVKDELVSMAMEVTALVKEANATYRDIFRA